MNAGSGACATLLALVVAAGARAEDWPQWRGPRSDGTSLERGLPTAWGRGRGVCWSADIPGEGHSSPIVSGGSVFVTTALGDGRERALVRVDAATGQLLWSKVVARSTDLESVHSENNHASSTPATDGRAVYTSFYESGRTHLAAVAFDGRVLWLTTVFKASPLRYEEEARNDLGDFVYATPALADGRMFIRTRNRLHVVGDCAGRRALSVPPAVRSGSR